MLTFEEYFAERESIRLKKIKGMAKPWTTDPILQSKFFCNNDRQHDWFSSWLMDNFYQYATLDTLPMYVIAGRFFNTEAPLMMLNSVGGTRWFESLHIVQSKLKTMMLDNVRMFNYSAYTRFLTPHMPVDFVNLIKQMRLLQLGNSANDFYEALLTADGIGPFLASQMTLDVIMVAPDQFADAEEWIPIGPGSTRGVCRVWGMPIEQNVTEDFVKSTIKKLAARLGVTSHVIEHSLCEYDKYVRYSGGRRGGRNYKGIS